MVKKKAKKTTKRASAKRTSSRGRTANMRKVKDTDVSKLKGKLLEVRKIGAAPIFVKTKVRDNVRDVLNQVNISTEDTDLKIEGMRVDANNWEELTLSTIIKSFTKIAVTTKVNGA